jgi:hypothetical protein
MLCLMRVVFLVHLDAELGYKVILLKFKNNIILRINFKKRLVLRMLIKMGLVLRN